MFLIIRDFFSKIDYIILFYFKFLNSILNYNNNNKINSKYFK